jgi:hypothetical protein
VVTDQHVSAAMVGRSDDRAARQSTADNSVAYFLPAASIVIQLTWRFDGFSAGYVRPVAARAVRGVPLDAGHPGRLVHRLGVPPLASITWVTPRLRRSAAIISTPKNVRYSSTSEVRVHARCPGVRIPTLIMSLWTSIPATRSYITLIRLPASCNGSLRNKGEGMPPAGAPRSVQETDTRARSSNGGYPTQGSSTKLRRGLERTRANQ